MRINAYYSILFNGIAVGAFFTDGEGRQFLIHNAVYEEGKECLDVKVHDSLTRNEDGLVSHTRVYRDETGKFSRRILFHREAKPIIEKA